LGLFKFSVAADRTVTATIVSGEAEAPAAFQNFAADMRSWVPH